MGQIKCPLCGKLFDPATSDAMPFCSKRCKLIDLGRWLREQYSLPVPREVEQEEDEPGSDRSDFSDEKPSA